MTLNDDRPSLTAFCVSKAPEEDTKESQNKTVSPTNAKMNSKDTAVEVLLSDLAEKKVFSVKG